MLCRMAKASVLINCLRKTQALTCHVGLTGGCNCWYDHHRDLAVILGAVVDACCSGHAKSSHVPQSAVVEVDSHRQGCQDSVVR